MLTFTRKRGESIILDIDPTIDPETPIGDVLSYPIQIKVDKTSSGSTKISIDAPRAIQVMRDELLEVDDE